MTDQLLRTELPKETIEKIEEILAKDPSWLTQPDIDFIRARRDYLTTEERRIFASILESQDESQPKKSKSQTKREAIQKESQDESQNA